MNPTTEVFENRLIEAVEQGTGSVDGVVVSSTVTAVAAFWRAGGGCCELDRAQPAKMMTTTLTDIDLCETYIVTPSAAANP